jgi:hypothetical protein
MAATVAALAVLTFVAPQEHDRAGDRRRAGLTRPSQSSSTSRTRSRGRADDVRAGLHDALRVGGRGGEVTHGQGERNSWLVRAAAVAIFVLGFAAGALAPSRLPRVGARRRAGRSAGRHRAMSERLKLSPSRRRRCSRYSATRARSFRRCARSRSRASRDTPSGGRAHASGSDARAVGAVSKTRARRTRGAGAAVAVAAAETVRALDGER